MDYTGWRLTTVSISEPPVYTGTRSVAPLGHRETVVRRRLWVPAIRARGRAGLQFDVEEARGARSTTHEERVRVRCVLYLVGTQMCELSAINTLCLFHFHGPGRLAWSGGAVCPAKIRSAGVAIRALALESLAVWSEHTPRPAEAR
jgi:hypothetical protein